jgi:hypothetical protein
MRAGRQAAVKTLFCSLFSIRCKNKKKAKKTREILAQIIPHRQKPDVMMPSLALSTGVYYFMYCVTYERPETHRDMPHIRHTRNISIFFFVGGVK